MILPATAILAVVALIGLSMAGDERIRSLVANTGMLAAASCLLAVPIGTGFAVLLLRTDLPGRRTLIFFAVLGLFTPLFLQAAGWDAGFGRLGWFSFSGATPGEPLLVGWRGAIWIHGCAAIPWVLLIVSTNLWYVEGEFEELALLEAPTTRVVWLVTLRRSLPAIGVSVLWVSMIIAGEMTITDLFQVRTYAEEIYISIPLEEFAGIGIQWRGLALTSAAMVAVALVATFSLAPPPATASDRPRVALRLGAIRYVALPFAASVVFLVVGLPLVNLAVHAGLVVRPVEDGVVRNWELAKFLSMVATAPTRYAAELMWSLSIGALSATGAMLVALPIAWQAIRRTWGAFVAVAVAALGLAIPGPLIGITVIWLLNRDPPWISWLYDRTLLAPCLAMLLRGLPLAILVSWYAIRSVAREVLEAAQTEGLAGGGLLWWIVAPQRVAALAAAWLAIFALSLGDLAATILVTPPGVSTIATRVFGLLHAGVDDQVAGLCLTTSALFAVIAGLSLILWRRIGRSS